MPEKNLNKGKDQSQSKEEEIGRGRNGILSPLSLLLLAVCLIQFVLLAAMTFGRRQFSSSQLPQPVGQATTNATPQEPYFKGHPGPWGNLEYARISLEPPDEFIPEDGHFFGPTRWFFEGYTRTTLGEFFGQCGLPAAQLAELMNPAAWSDTTNGVLVTPSDDMVLGLDEPARERIYSVLANNQANMLYLWPFKSTADNFDAWFGRAGLSQETLALLKKLTYRRGKFLCLSDMFVIYPRISDIGERRRLIKMLARTPTLLMKLQVKPDSDVNELGNYWAKGRRSKDIEALLDSLTKIPGGMTIDIAHLLPPFARKRLYTFPVPFSDPSAPWPDCNWTAMNFFHDPPDDHYYDNDAWQHELSENYTQVFPPTFGDLIVFLRPDGAPIHMAVYIADDVVFTKNGSSNYCPWTLMKWDDLVSDYTLDYTPKFAVFRPKMAAEQ